MNDQIRYIKFNSWVNPRIYFFANVILKIAQC